MSNIQKRPAKHRQMKLRKTQSLEGFHRINDRNTREGLYVQQIFVPSNYGICFGGNGAGQNVRVIRVTQFGGRRDAGGNRFVAGGTKSSCQRKRCFPPAAGFPRFEIPRFIAAQCKNPPQLQVMPKKKQTPSRNELERVDHFKRLVVAAMFSDGEMNQRFVLKGGNAIDLVLQVGTRASIDIDLSMEDDFSPEELKTLSQRLERNLMNVFSPEGYKVFDLTLEEKPPAVSSEIAQFWGGYMVTFKLIEAAKYQPVDEALDAMRRQAIHIGPKGKFQIDISKFEYCPSKQEAEIEGRQIFAYTPEMLVCEKLRAICQQMPEYGPIVKRTRPGSARARDFVDIRVLMERFSIELVHPDNLDLLRHTFAAKKAPFDLLANLERYRDFHRPDFQAVKDSVKPGVSLEDFDFYFDYVLALGERLLKALGNK